MTVLARPAALLVTASLAAGLIAAPGAAWAADPTTELTAVQMQAALKPVSAATAAAGATGWRATTAYRFTLPSGSMSASGTITADLTHGLYSELFDFGGHGGEGSYVAAGRGLYDSIATDEEEAALRMMGRGTVRYAFTADKSLDLAEFLEENEASPASTAAFEGMAGRRTGHDDGSADYVFAEEEGVSLTLHVGPGGVVSGIDVTAADGASRTEAVIGYSYGPQTVTLPAASATIAAGTLSTGVAYLQMAATVRSAADSGAAAARKAAKGGVVKVASLRSAVKVGVSAANTSVKVKMVKAANVAGGVRVSATNPWTRKTVAYTVKASGKKVVVKKV